MTAMLIITYISLTDNGGAKVVPAPASGMVSNTEGNSRSNPWYRVVWQIQTEAQMFQTREHGFHGVYRLGGLKITPHQDCLLCLMMFLQQDMAGRNTIVITAFLQPSRRSRDFPPLQTENIINTKQLPLPRQMKRPNGREEEREEQPEEQPRRLRERL